jgi:hypothetical protein
MDFEYIIPIILALLAIFNIIYFIFYKISKLQISIFVSLTILSMIFGFIVKLKNIIYLSFMILISTIGIFGLIVFISGLYLIRKYKGEPVVFENENFLKL